MRAAYIYILQFRLPKVAAFGSACVPSPFCPFYRIDGPPPQFDLSDYHQSVYLRRHIPVMYSLIIFIVPRRNELQLNFGLITCSGHSTYIF